MPFSPFGLHADLQRALRTLGFERPTPVQREVIPPALEGRDILASAMTGSGKTAAFALPILQRLGRRPRGTTRALVLTPTRELAAQIDEHVRALAGHTRFTSATVFGGLAMGPQEKAFRRGVDVIVATPGRLPDHMCFPYAALRGLEILVLDEADRMLDMGFLPDVRRSGVIRRPAAVRVTGAVTGPTETPPDQASLMRSEASRYPSSSRELAALGPIGRVPTPHKEFEAHVRHEDE
jgi:ATP-dependent RNA helicase RhlE